MKKKVVESVFLGGYTEKSVNEHTNGHRRGIRRLLVLVVLGCLLSMGCGEEPVIFEDSNGSIVINGSEELSSESVDDIVSMVVSNESEPGNVQQKGEVQSGDAVLYDAEASVKKPKAVVHVCGAVNRPGVYEVDSSGRIIDAVNAAGGFRSDAADMALNLASPITDGSRVYIPTFEEYEAGLETGVYGIEKGYRQNEVTEADATVQMNNSDTRVNINTAGVDELMTLTGIGESRAKSIIEYRGEHGAFRSIEDIMGVPGIKEGAFNKIKDDIRIN